MATGQVMGDGERIHVHNVCEEAGLQVMEQVYDILSNREVLPRDVFTLLTVTDVTGHYFGIVGPAIDAIESDMLAWHQGDEN